MKKAGRLVVDTLEEYLERVKNKLPLDNLYFEGILHFPSKSVFGGGCYFSRYTKFGDSCIFGKKTWFARHCEVGEGCTVESMYDEWFPKGLKIIGNVHSTDRGVDGMLTNTWKFFWAIVSSVKNNESFIDAEKPIDSGLFEQHMHLQQAEHRASYYLKEVQEKYKKHIDDFTKEEFESALSTYTTEASRLQFRR